MYTVTELSKLLGVSRPTLYNKLKHDTLKEFVKEAEKGLQMEEEGMNALQLLLADSKVNVNENKDTVKEQNQNNYTEEYILNLKTQIDDLKREKEEYKKRIGELEVKVDGLMNMLIESNNSVKFLSDKSKFSWFRRK